jgi:hypothetical protein
MRILQDRGLPDNVKCGAVIDDHRHELQDIDRNKHAVSIISIEMEHTLDDFVGECLVPQESQCNRESSCTIKATIAYHHGKRRTQNEVHNGSFPVKARIWFEFIAEEIKFAAHCFVDIVLI